MDISELLDFENFEDIVYIFEKLNDFESSDVTPLCFIFFFEEGEDDLALLNREGIVIQYKLHINNKILSNKKSPCRGNIVKIIDAEKICILNKDHFTEQVVDKIDESLIFEKIKENELIITCGFSNGENLENEKYIIFTHLPHTFKSATSL